jgi:hypothetical protein
MKRRKLSRVSGGLRIRASRKNEAMTSKAHMLWTFAITSIALFMVTLDNLVVTTALPVIRRDLHASLQELEWTVNASTLTFAVLLLAGAALGAWGGIGGLAVALGPLVGGAIVQGISWQWIFVKSMVATLLIDGVAGAAIFGIAYCLWRYFDGERSNRGRLFSGQAAARELPPSRRWSSAKRCPTAPRTAAAPTASRRCSTS